ncbi:MAG: hypothetical protein QOJ03_830, partial [Frankiaceae bacterium]|nr:hypothetical protein [Frankiaceae bacterium]
AWDKDTDAAWLEANGTDLGFGITTAPHNIDDTDAAIGILGVQLDPSSTYADTVHVGSAISDPNNDGKLDLGAQGELGADGASSGLATVDIANPGGGTLAANLVIKPRDASVIAGLPGVEVTVGLSDSDWGITPAATASYADDALDSVQAFERLSTYDLAQGVAQLAATLREIQQSEHPNGRIQVDLPFLHGTVADLVPASEALDQFLLDNIAPGTDPNKPGQPLFASIQQMFASLEGTTGPHGTDVYEVTVPDASFEGAGTDSPTLPFTVHVHRDPSDQAADPVANVLTGGPDSVTYTDTTIVDSAPDAQWLDVPHLSDYLRGLRGRQVTVGASSGVIKNIVPVTTETDGVVTSVDKLTFTLDGDAIGATGPSAWKGGTPAGALGYVIAGGDPQTGLVQLADSLAGTSGISGANASRPQATITPGYDIELPLVLDLEKSATGGDCVAAGAGQACPFTATSNGGNGLSYVVQEWPLRSDRFRFVTGSSTPLLEATSVMTTPVDITAPVGYVPVHITGDLTVCPTSGYDDKCVASGSPGTLQTISVSTPPSSSTADMALSDVFAAARDHASDLLTGSTEARAFGDLHFAVVDDDGFFGASPGHATVSAPVDGTAPPAPDDPAGDLAKLKVLDVKPGTPAALFSVLLADLGAVDSTLHSPVGGGGVDKPLPLLGQSLGSFMSGTDTVADPNATYRTVDKDGNAATPGAFLELSTSAYSFQASDFARPVVIGSNSYVIANIPSSSKVWLTSVPTSPPAKGTPFALGDGLQHSLAAFTASAPTDMHALLTQLVGRLGTGSTVGFTVDSASKVMTLTVDWKRKFTTQSQLGLDLRNPQAVLAGDAAATGVVPVNYSGVDHLVLNIPLDSAGVADPVGTLRIDGGTSSRLGRVLVDSASGKGFTSAVGPIAVTIGDGGAAEHTDLKADLGATLSKTGADQKLTDWSTGLAPTSFNTGDAQTCSGVTGSDLALCASLPLHFTGGTDTLTVALPRSDTDFAHAIDPLNGTRENDLPNLAAALNAAKFNPAPLGQGLLTFIDQATDGLGVATANGKLPLVGKDLQAGADFLGSLRSALSGSFDPSKFTTPPAKFSDVQNVVKQALNDAGAGLQTSAPSVDGVCAMTIGPPSNVNVSVHDPNESGETRAGYAYTVVGTVQGGALTRAGTSGSVQNRSVLGAPASNKATNTVSWTPAAPSAHVTGYDVYRKINSGGWQLVAHVNGGSSNQVVDSGQGGAAGPASPGAASDPKFSGPCDPQDGSETIQSLTVHVQYGKGDNIGKAEGCKTADGTPSGDAKECLTASLPLDLGLPGLSLHALKDPTGEVHNDVRATLGWKLDLTVTLDKAKGVLLETTAGAGNHLRVGAAISVPDMEANLSFLHVQLKKHGGGDAAAPIFHAVFDVGLKCPASCSNGQLPIGQVLTADPSKVFNAGISGGFDINEDISTDIDPSLPGLGADFVFKAHWDDDANPLDLSKFHVEALEFDKIEIDPGSFLGSTIYPIVQDVVNTMKPIQPIIDTITAPIPVLSDLSHLVGGDDVTLVTLAESFGDGSTSVQEVIDILKAVSKLSKLLQSVHDGKFTLGSFKIVEAKAETTEDTPEAADSLIGPVYSGNDTSGSPGALTDVITALNGKFDHSGDDPKLGDDDIGVAFPALEDPKQLLKLFVGGDATLATFDSGELKFGFSFSQSFGPVYAPPPVMVVISGSADVTLHVKAGFDTYGNRRAVETGQPAQILNSLFFFTNDDNGAPIPVVSFHGELAAGAEINVVFLKAGVEGGIALTVNFTWRDPNNDGKFRFEEFLAAALSNPICLFNVGGELSIFIKVYITIGFSPFDVSFDFTLVNIKLLDFSISPDCEPDPPKLAAETPGKVLYLFAGKLGNDPRGDSAWWAHKDGKDSDETWVVHQQDGDGTFMVKALGFEQVFPADVQSIVLDARGYGGKLNVLFQPGKGLQDPAQPESDTNTMVDKPFGAKVYVFGGDTDDTIKVSDSKSYVDGGDGADTITTGDRPHPEAADTSAFPFDRVAGDGGKDHITVGNDADLIGGDGWLSTPELSSDVTDAVTYGVMPKKDQDTGRQPPFDPDKATQVTVPAGVIDPSQSVVFQRFVDPRVGAPGADVIQAGIGGDTVYGGGENDTISVAQDSPLAGVASYQNVHDRLVDAGTKIFGNDGSDRINGGSGPDVIYTGDVPLTDSQYADLPVQDNPGSADAPGTGDSRTLNTVDTNTGNDKVFGSAAIDVVFGHSTASQHDLIYGMGGDDVLSGGQGTDSVYGGRGDDYINADPTQPNENVGGFPDQVGTAHWTFTPQSNQKTTVSKTLVGGGGSDRIFGGNGPSAIWGDHDQFRPDDVSPYETDACVSPGPDESDPPAEHPRDADNHPAGDNDPSDYDAADLITGGVGADTIQAGGGADWVYATDGTNLVCGEGGADHLYGGNAVDTIYGGSNGDVVQGYRGADLLYGNDGGDFVYGNADNDLIEGNDGADVLFGGENDDLVIGGTTSGNRPDTGDVIFGDTGQDTLIGDNGDSRSSAGPVFDLSSTDSSLGGDDIIFGGDAADHVYGGLENDTVLAGDGADYVEGNPGTDTLYGQTGADDIAGGSAQLPGDDPTVTDAVGYPDQRDIISGGPADDVILGDDGQITDTTLAGADPVMKGRGLTVGRHVIRYDVGYSPAAANSGPDDITGDSESDVIFGQGAADTVHGNDGEDYVEGGQADDHLYGDAGQDDIAGGSLDIETGTGQNATGQLDTGDTISGGPDADVIIGDNGQLTRDPAIPASDITKARSDTDALPAVQMVQRSIRLYDLGDSPLAGVSGGDYITGDDGSDAILGQAGNDRVLAGFDGDYAEGGPGRDWVEGNAGDDDLLGGSSTILGSDTGATTQGQPDVGDAVWGGDGDDLITGDNSVTDRNATPSPYLFRIGSTGALETQRSLRLLDLKWGSDFLTDPTRSVAGGDQLSGGAGVDVVFGQDGPDTISGGANDDYAEGNGGHDTMFGDRSLIEAGISIVAPTPNWPGDPSGEADMSSPNGQDDLLGGASIQAFRDTQDEVHGDGAADYILGDNGTVVRDLLDSAKKLVTTVADAKAAGTGLTNRIYVKRYPASLPSGAAYVRHGTSATSPTRYCVGSLATCEPPKAAGADNLWGDAGDDTVYGQDGNDHLYGDSGSTARVDATSLAVVNDGGGVDPAQRNDDDLYGELGNDVIWGELGDDAMLGDRGGIVDQFQTGSNKFVIDNSQVPKIHYEGFLAGSVTRVADLQHDVNGDAFIGMSASAAMPHRGDLDGGSDRMRGGVGHDSMHGGSGNDLMNGDSGGDIAFGDDGADLIWGGKGSDDAANLNDRGVNDSLVDYIIGGKGGTDAASIAGAVGSDILDWHPRGSFSPTGTYCTANTWPTDVSAGPKATVTLDPCSWYEMTDLDDATNANNQHHQGIDWMYGGWDRDVLQGDVADNGPNLGDRLLDWNGAFNLYTHCNAAYGGYNDVRQHSPAHQDFLQRWVWSLGSGQAQSDAATGTTTSAFDELALAYPGQDNDHAAGSAYPSTPGHFDNPNAGAP